jgi:L-lactate dehydrogenase (cytochrome)
MIIASPADFRTAALKRLPRFLADYLEGGAFSEQTMRRNVADLADVHLRQRVLRGPDSVDLATSLFGKAQALPVVLGPVGLTGMYRKRGEVQVARAATASGVPYCLPTLSVCSIAEVAAAAPLPWFQLYVLKDRGFMRDVIDRAKTAGVTTLALTVDLPLPGIRYRDDHSGLSGPGSALKRIEQSLVSPGWLMDVGLGGKPHELGNASAYLQRNIGLQDYIGWLKQNFDPGIGFDLIDEVRKAWSGALVIKGVLDADDARECVARGADGIVVSNHGGRQLDGALSSVRALPRIVDAVGDTTTVLVDGGIRNGLDIVRMMSLGADGVLLGRAYIYALAAQGQAGVERLLAMLATEMRIAMTLAGAGRLSELGPALIDRAD